jgi:hypothetical protein
VDPIDLEAPEALALGSPGSHGIPLIRGSRGSQGLGVPRPANHREPTLNTRCAIRNGTAGVYVWAWRQAPRPPRNKWFISYLRSQFGYRVRRFDVADT